MIRRDSSIHSPAIGREMRLIAYGHFGPPMLVFPTMNCRATDWEDHGMIHALAPWIEGGRIKLYCVESIEHEAWMNWGAPPQWRAKRALAFEDFVMRNVLPAIHEDCRSDSIGVMTSGMSTGGLHAANFVLKHPGTFTRAFCFSGRYDLGTWFEGFYNEDVYFNDPVAYVANMEGAHLTAVREHCHLTLVVGQGAHEGGCIPQTHRLADLLAAKGIPHWRDIWGRDSAHDWPWWRKQAAYHFSHAFGAP